MLYCPNGEIWLDLCYILHALRPPDRKQRTIWAAWWRVVITLQHFLRNCPQLCLKRRNLLPLCCYSPSGRRSRRFVKSKHVQSQSFCTTFLFLSAFSIRLLTNVVNRQLQMHQECLRLTARQSWSQSMEDELVGTLIKIRPRDTVGVQNSDLGNSTGQMFVLFACSLPADVPDCPVLSAQYSPTPDVELRWGSGPGLSC